MRRVRATTGGAEAHLRRRPVLLHRWREGVGVGSWWFHIVVAEAAEERAEDASVPLLLHAALGLGRCQNRRQGGERAAGEQAAGMQILCDAIKKWNWETFTFSCLHAEQWEKSRTCCMWVSAITGETFGVIEGHQGGLC